MAVEAIRKWMKKLGTMRKSIKPVSETGVKSDPAFCMGPTNENTNGVFRH